MTLLFAKNKLFAVLESSKRDVFVFIILKEREKKHILSPQCLWVKEMVSLGKKMN